MTQRQPQKIIAALNAPTSTNELLVKVTSIIQRMTGNSWFPSPQPPLATIQSLWQATYDAQTAAQMRTIGTAAARDARERDLRGGMRRLQAYVQSVADKDMANAAVIVASAGFDVKKSTAYMRSPFAARRGLVAGSAILTRSREKKRAAAYEWQWSLDKVTWNDLPLTLRASTSVSDLPVGKYVYFRTRSTTVDGTSNWSDPIQFLVH